METTKRVCAYCDGYGMRALGYDEPARWDGQQWIPGDEVGVECDGCDGTGEVDDGPPTDDPWPPEDDAIMDWIRSQEDRAHPEGSGDWIERYSRGAR